MPTNHRPRPESTNWGDMVDMCKQVEPVNTNLVPGPVNANLVPGPLNANLVPGPVNTNLVSGPVNTNWGLGSVNTNLGPDPGPGAKQRAGGQGIQIPVLIDLFAEFFMTF